MSKKIVCKIDSTGSKEFDSLRDKMHSFATETIRTLETEQEKVIRKELEIFTVDELRHIGLAHMPIEISDGRMTGKIGIHYMETPSSLESAQAIYDHIHATVK